MTPRRILWIGVLPPHQGGAAVSASQMLRGLARAGHTIRTLGPITAEAAEAGERFAVQNPDLGVTRFLMPPCETPTNVPEPAPYRELERHQIETELPPLLERERPDVIVLGRETFAWSVPAVARRHRVPCILRIAGSFLSGVLAGNFPPAVLSQWLEQALQVDRVLAQTTTIAADAASVGLGRATIIPNAVDLRLFTPAPKDAALRRALRVEDDRIVVMHVSNLKRVKRALDVVDSAAHAVRVNPTLVYVIVGDGADRHAMEEAARRHGVADHFRFAGWVPYDDVPAYLNLADMVVMPSESEAQARVYLETQACARTLMASDIPGARHVVDDGATGLLFEKGDAAGLAAATLRAAADPALRAAIGQKARERVVVHSLDHVVALYSETIERMLHERALRG